MGQVISSHDNQDDIFADVATAVTNSAALGGTVSEIALTALVPTHLAIGKLDVELLAARKDASPILAMADVAKAKAFATVRLAYDMTWNYVGRPASDGKLSSMYPGGASHYVEGDVHLLSGRMEFLARLYDKGIHPKLSAVQNADIAESIRVAAKAYSDALEAARMPMTEVMLLERTRTVMARSAQSTLVNFKRLLKMAGFTEAQVHTIIPDRKPPSKKASAKRAAAKKAAAEASAASTPAASASVASAPAASAPVASASAPAASMPAPAASADSAASADPAVSGVPAVPAVLVASVPAAPASREASQSLA